MSHRERWVREKVEIKPGLKATEKNANMIQLMLIRRWHTQAKNTYDNTTLCFIIFLLPPIGMSLKALVKMIHIANTYFLLLF